MMLRPLLAATLFALSALPASATGEIESLITQESRERLATYDATRAAALERARAGGVPADVAILDALADAKPISKDGFDMTGPWRCRTILAGSAAPLIVYDWFRCRVSDDGAGWRLEKLSGSQRTDGRFYDDGDTRMIYLGSYFSAGERPALYGANSELDQVGYAYRIDDEHWRLELPSRGAAAPLNILEFRR